MDSLELPHKGNRWAILVEAGVTVNFPLDEDVTRVRGWLHNGPFGVPNENIKCFNSPEHGPALSTAANITAALKSWRDLDGGVQQHDYLFFYFLGHGTTGGGLQDCNNVTIAPTVLTNIFDQIAIRGLNLTVVLNACHSGNLQPAEAVLANSYPDMGGLPKYNLLAACSPFQSTTMGVDNEVGGEDYYGARLTYYMLKALNENPRCTLEMIRRRAFAAGRLSIDTGGGMPMLWKYDNNNRSFFDKAKNKVLPSSIAARWIDLDHVELAAGEAHGVIPGSEYTLYPWDSISERYLWRSDKWVPPDAPAAQIRVRVTNISGLTSTARVSFGGNRAAFYANPAGTPATTWACQAVPFKLDPMEQEYRRMLNLTNIDSALPNIFSFGVLYNETLYDVFNTTGGERPTEGTNPTAGGNHKLRFRMNRNLQYRFVLLTVLRFTEKWDVHKCYPRLADYEVVRPGTDCVFELPRHMSTDSETSTYKAFITTAPTPLDFTGGLKIQGRLMTGARNEVFRVDHESPIPTEVTTPAAWGEFRDAEVPEHEITSPPEMWRTMSVTIHRTRNNDQPTGHLR